MGICMRKLLFLLVVILVVVVTACSHASQVADVPALQQEADTWPRCISGCVANDVEINSVSLNVSVGNYTLGETVTHNVSMNLYFHRQNTYCIVVVADLYEAGMLQQTNWVSNIIGYHGGSGNYTYEMGAVNWTYGTLFEMGNVLVMWAPNSPQGGTCPIDCTEYTAPSKCNQPDIFVVTTPLVADFEFNEVCLCNNTTFTDRTTGGAKPYTWYWDFGDGNSSTTQNATHHFDAAGTYGVTLNVTDSDSPPATASQSYNVTVNAKPTADAGSDQSISSCGGSVSIGGSPTGSGGTGPYTYNWTPTTGLDNPAIPNPTASAAGTYTVIVTDANGCWNEDSLVITASGAPTADAGPDQEICPGGSVQIGGSPTGWGGTGPYTYNWTPTAGLNNSAIANPYASPTSTTTYSVLLTDGDGCQAADSVTVTVHDTPACHISASPDASVCQGTTVTLTEDGGDAVSWSWSTGAHTQSIQVTSGGTYDVTITDTHGCQSNCQISVTVYDAPTADAGSDEQICAGGSVVIGGSPTGSGGTGALTYSWSPISGLDNPAASNPNASPSSTTVYTVTVTDSEGCTDTDSMTVMVIGGPTANAGGDTGFCAGGSVQLSGLATGGATPYTYDWIGPESHPSTQNPSVNTAGTYTLTVTDDNGCSDTDDVIVSQYSSPTADAGPDRVIIAGDSAVIGGTATASGGTPPYSFSWTPTTGLNDPSFANPTASPAVNATYTVTVTDFNGCTDSNDVTVTVIQDCCICGFVYRAGTMEPLADWEVVLEQHTNPWVEIGRTTTDASGKYCFCGFGTGDYRVSEVVQPNWNQVSPLPNEYLVTLPGGCCDPDYGPFRDFENEQGGPFAVGWEASPIDRAAVLAPWIALFAAIVAGTGLLVLRRRRT
jgi:PKD repeat protein